MSIKGAIAFRELQERVATLAALMEQLVKEHATQEGRLTAIEATTAAECATCAARRAGDAARQRRRRHRQAGATEKLEHVYSTLVGDMHELPAYFARLALGRQLSGLREAPEDAGPEDCHQISPDHIARMVDA